MKIRRKRLLLLKVISVATSVNFLPICFFFLCMAINIHNFHGLTCYLQFCVPILYHYVIRIFPLHKVLQNYLNGNILFNLMEIL